jgi:hypothetical protein
MNSVEGSWVKKLSIIRRVSVTSIDGIASEIDPAGNNKL